MTLLKEMLFPAPYEVPEKKAKKKATGTMKGLRRKVVSDSSSEDTEAHSSNENKEEEEENLLRESWIRGCPDSRTITVGRTPGL